jgi:hypothetical protein
MLLVMSVALDLARDHLLPVGSFGTWGELVVLRLCPFGEPSRGFAFVPTWVLLFPGFGVLFTTVLVPWQCSAVAIACCPREPSDA